jgi:signal transduction histidine kinase
VTPAVTPPLRVGLIERLPEVQVSALRAGVTAIAYFLTAMLGEALAFPSAPVSALWAPNAILFAALLSAPTRHWWMYLLAIVPVHFTAQLPVSPFSQVFIQYVVNCAESVLGAMALLCLERRPIAFDRLSATANLIVIGSLAVPFATSVAMAAGFALAGVGGDFWLTTVARTLTNAFATMTLVPLIDHVIAHRPHVRTRLTGREAAEALLIASSLFLIGIAVFVWPEPNGDHMPALLYAPVPILLWATVRFGITAACTSVLLVGAAATIGILHGNGPFVTDDPVENALWLVLFLIVTSAPLLLLASVLEERRQTSAALLTSEVLHRAVLASLQNQIAVLDQSGVVINANDSWRQGVAKLARPIVLPGENYFTANAAGAERGDAVCLSVHKHLQPVMSGAEQRCQFEFSVRGPDGMYWFEQTIEALQRPEGGIVITISDATARKRAELEVEDQQQQLARLARFATLGEFAGAIAHEIRQPLAAILANAEAAALQLLERRPDLAVVREAVDDIIADDLRAAEVIQRLRSMLHNAEPERLPMRLNDVVNESLLLARGDLARRGVTANAYFEPALPSILGDRVQIQQVVLNLIINACDAMVDVPEERRQLTLTTRRIGDDDEIEFRVCDSGCGIDEKLIGRIFEPFVTSKAGGLGLGLSISKSIVEAHGGRMWAENIFPGAAFHIVLPGMKTHDYSLARPFASVSVDSPHPLRH